MSNPSASDTGVDRSRSGSGLPARPGSFVAQVMNELRKVVRPTQRELVTYTIVVLVFVCVIMAYVFGLDQVFQQLVGLVFG
ncbi:MAG TPA: preprotein translocase subunit SecE [Ornithinimicrobium sp.]|uniref:preprotein translocase subunit SecE n=1 Tax=Ornithinimicrobium sp. TaxID=1977084 RepID=UPI002B4A6AE7|nr:preprotein translocase subunit SecE [Ornithinimicrobium sp.]HKJ11310.1 preprotein translocase subunit SecE [Ornithinimicrobium sp.]